MSQAWGKGSTRAWRKVRARVLARDAHRCRLQIDRALSGRDAMGPTLDHLVPISQGGEHSYANVRAAHRRCNSRRGIGGVVQLALVG